MPDTDSALTIRGTVLIGRSLVPGAVVVVRDGLIEAVGREADVVVPDAGQVIDAADNFVVPGFVDIHIHGSGGCRAEDDAQGMARYVIRHGTTWFLPTLISNDFEVMLRSIDHIRANVGPVDGGATIGGIHLEGPFLNPKYGAQRSETNIEPDPESVRRLIDRSGDDLRLVTIAPERHGAIDAIRRFRAAGATVSIGHTDASEEDYNAARRAGVTHATHVFNAMPSGKWPVADSYDGRHLVGPAELIMGDDEMSADIMSDSGSHHVHPTMLKIALHCKGPQKLSLITDAMVSAGLPPGEHKMADGQSIYTAQDEDVVRLASGVICGSVLSMNGALRNFVEHTGTTLETALVMVSEAPARVVGQFDRKGSIAAGKDADLVLLDKNLDVRSVFVAGQAAPRQEECPV